MGGEFRRVVGVGVLRRAQEIIELGVGVDECATVGLFGLRFEVELEREFLEKEWIAQSAIDDLALVIGGDVLTDGVDKIGCFSGTQISHLEPADIEGSSSKHLLEAAGFRGVSARAPGADNKAGEVSRIDQDIAQQTGGIPTRPCEVIEDDEDGALSGEDAKQHPKGVDGGTTTAFGSGLVGGAKDGEEPRSASAVRRDLVLEFGAEPVADIRQACGYLVPALQDE